MKLIFTLLIIIPLYCCGRQNLKDISRNSAETLIYTITAGEAEQFIEWDSIPLERFERAQPFMRTIHTNLDAYSLPNGFYVQVAVRDNKVHTEMFSITNLEVLTINNKSRVQLVLRTKDGSALTGAAAYTGHKSIPFNGASGTFWLQQRRLEHKIIKVTLPGDTAFISLAGMNDQDESIATQRRINYRHSTLHKWLNAIPALFRSMKKKNNKPGRSYNYGYVLFNQPKYKPSDTVQFKAYLLNRKELPLREPVDVFLEYSYHGRQVSQKLYTLKPLTEGAFTGSFFLADTLPNDTKYQLSFKNNKAKQLINGRFSVEDYIIEEMSVISFNILEKNIYRNDSLRFTADIKDANGLRAMDASAKLIVTNETILDFFGERVLVSDTLYQQEKNLLTTGETIFSFSSAQFPAANMQLQAKIIFKNSNNELQERTGELKYIYQSDEIVITQVEDSLKAVLLQNGISVKGKGFVQPGNGKRLPVAFPYQARIDPSTEKYTFTAAGGQPGKDIYKAFDVEDDYRVHLSRANGGDTLGFELYNPYRIPVYFSVFNGNRLIATGSSSNKTINWSKRVENERRLYRVTWQYWWAGRERKSEEYIGLPYKILNISINGSDLVFPGQKDSVKIEVKDYKGKPAANVNLTAMSYNNQLSANIRVAEPPYLGRYRSKRGLLYEGFESDGNYEIKNEFPLGKHPHWINVFRLDTMPYYQLLFPRYPYADKVTLIDGFLPQLSVNVVQHGVPQEVYLLYINRELVYYNGVTDKAAYAFPVMPDNVMVGIRLKDKFIQIDSLYLQPNYKHDLSFDLDRLPQHSTLQARENYWSNEEIDQLESSILQLDNNSYQRIGYAWQGYKIVALQGARNHLLGPFDNGQISFFSPGFFDIHPGFEPGYQYRLSKEITRLEKKPLFNPGEEKHFLPVVATANMQLGDTLVDPPKVSYPKKIQRSELRANRSNYGSPITAMAVPKLQFITPKDTLVRYIVCQPVDSVKETLIFMNQYNRISSLEPGSYNIYFVTADFYTANINGLSIIPASTLCLDTKNIPYRPNHPYINWLLQKAVLAASETARAKDSIRVAEPVRDTLKVVPTGPRVLIRGRIIDARGGHPIPFVSVRVKNMYTGTSSDASGRFFFTVYSSKQVLVFSAIGYTPKEIEIDPYLLQHQELVVLMVANSNMLLREVVVTGAFNIKRSAKSVTSYVREISASTLNNALAGKVSGLQVRSQFATNLGRENIVRLRGENGTHTGNTPIYVVDGIIYDIMPAHIKPENIVDVTTLEGPAAAALFGPAAAGGAIVITTGTKTLRKEFRDYAFWQPNFFTDSKGTATIVVEYPDNITAWRTFIVAMDRRKRVGKTSVLTRSYKPVMAQLSAPQFLIEGDSSVLIGKQVNYSNNAYETHSRFTLKGIGHGMRTDSLIPDAALTNSYAFTAQSDTLMAGFEVNTTTGFKDGEERKIPVLKKGTTEASGAFWVMDNDMPVGFTAAAPGTDVHIYAQNNTLDLLLGEVEQLKHYPYYCMEQTASKLTGYAMEKKIKLALNQPVKNNTDAGRLLVKLQKAQQFDGGWSWWGQGNSDFYITNYIAAALQHYRDEPLVETNIRNAFLFLQQQLPALTQEKLLAALVTLSDGKHTIDYEPLLKRIDFDSLNQHQQWQWVRVRQQQHLPYADQLSKLARQGTVDMLGGMHWGTENYRWYNNSIATTVIAFKVLQEDSAHRELLPAVIQYFLACRKGGYWNNTVESASIVSSILPYILQQQHDFMKPATVEVKGDSNFSITKFPFHARINTRQAGNFNFTKSGGGVVYLTAYQEYFNRQPAPMTDYFAIKTGFRRAGVEINSLKAGEKINLQVEVTVKKDAEYVMMEIPVPAGCVIMEKDIKLPGVYAEFYKDKVMLFVSSMYKGTQHFNLKLEARYTGRYCINPVKATLMYFPTFFGRTGIEFVDIH